MFFLPFYIHSLNNNCNSPNSINRLEKSHHSNPTLDRIGTPPNASVRIVGADILFLQRRERIRRSPMDDETFRIEDIYVPAKRRATLDPSAVTAIAESMLEEGQRTPIQVRRDGERLVLVEGFQRLEACRSLGEETIVGIAVRARRS
jgi:sulfiredoxin